MCLVGLQREFEMSENNARNDWRIRGQWRSQLAKLNPGMKAQA